MVDPFVQWSPERLRLVGLSLALAGASVLTTIPLSAVETTPRQRLVLAASIGACSYYSIDRVPDPTGVVTLLSAALAVLVPLVLSAKVVHQTVTA